MRGLVIDHKIRSFLMKALSEDIGPGDVTTDSIFPEVIPSRGIIRAKEDLILAGIDVVKEVFALIDAEIIFTSLHRDIERVKKGEVIAEIMGDGRTLLKGERVALNIIQRLSGIATLTRRYVEEVEGYKVRILDTRKTAPNLRVLEKYAVRVGGGWNHRLGLFDGVLIKDNHIALAGSIKKAVRRVRENAPHTLKIEVEVKNLEEAQEAIALGADIIMLDNMGLDDIRRAVGMVKGRLLIEVSGNVDLSKIRDIASAGVDFISIGALTHSAPAVDISMEISKWMPKG